MVEGKSELSDTDWPASEAVIPDTCGVRVSSDANWRPVPGARSVQRSTDGRSYRQDAQQLGLCPHPASAETRRSSTRAGIRSADAFRNSASISPAGRISLRLPTWTLLSCMSGDGPHRAVSRRVIACSMSGGADTESEVRRLLTIACSSRPAGSNFTGTRGQCARQIREGRQTIYRMKRGMEGLRAFPIPEGRSGRSSTLPGEPESSGNVDVTRGRSLPPAGGAD